MLTYTTFQSLGQARLDEMHDQARRDALAKSARRARRVQRQQAAHRKPALLAGLTLRARRPEPAPDCL